MLNGFARLPFYARKLVGCCGGLKRIPSRQRRGLGLLDTLLAASILSVAALVGAEVFRQYVDRAVIGAEARALFNLSDAGRKYLLVDPTVRKPVSGGVRSISETTLMNDGMWSSVRGFRTPGRGRDMSLVMWEESPDNILIVSRARHSRGIAPSGVAYAGDGVFGVGIVLDGFVRGAGIHWDISGLNTAMAGFLAEGDLVSVRHIPLGQMADVYLHRNIVPGRAILNTMLTNLDMGGRDVNNTGRLVTNELFVDQISPVLGSTSTQVNVAGNVVVNGTLTARGSLDVSGSLSASGLARVGVLNVTNRATVGSLGVTNTVRSNTLETNTSLDSGAFFANDVVARDVTTGTIHTGGCTGC